MPIKIPVSSFPFALQRMRLLLLTAVTLLISGCYYWQAASGHLQLMQKRRPIADLIAAGELPPQVQERLELVVQARQFAIDTLKLPDNDSYRTYADLDRDFAVWNIMAAPEFSLQPKIWCFPVAGCVSYRGYFSRSAAQQYARSLRAQGYDVAVGGVAAYSTLGRFGDPVLNTMLYQDDARLLGLIFHELAHQVVYIPGETDFNEAFATAVEEYGVQLWLEYGDRPDALAAYRKQVEWQRRLLQLTDGARGALNRLYAGDLDPVQKRQLKHEILRDLRKQVNTEYRLATGSTDNWFNSTLNNAWLAVMATYRDLLPVFRRLLRGCDNNIECFYLEVEALAALKPELRKQRLQQLSAR